MFPGSPMPVSSVDNAGKDCWDFLFLSVKTCKRLRYFLNEKYYFI